MRVATDRIGHYHRSRRAVEADASRMDLVQVISLSLPGASARCDSHSGVIGRRKHGSDALRDLGIQIARSLADLQRRGECETRHPRGAQMRRMTRERTVAHMERGEETAELRVVAVELGARPRVEHLRAECRLSARGTSDRRGAVGVAGCCRVVDVARTMMMLRRMLTQKNK